MRRYLLLVAALGLLSSASANAQSAWTSSKGTLEGGVGYQLVLTDGNYGNLTEHGTLSFEGLESYTINNIFLSAGYSITDRFALSASVPYTNIKFTGETDFLPHGPEDGTHKTYSHFQDLTTYAQYMFPVNDMLTVTPLLGFNYPLTDYATVGHGIVGLGRWDVRPGVAAGLVVDRFFSQLVAYHQIPEEIGPYSRWENSRTNASLSAGYSFTDALSAHVGGAYRHTWKGTSFKDLGPIVGKLTAMPAQPLTPEEQAIFDHHDVNVQERGFILRLGASYRAFDFAQLDASYMRTLFGDSMQAAQAFNVGVTMIYDVLGGETKAE